MQTDYYTLQDVEKIVDRSYKTINRWLKKGIFPQPVKITLSGKNGPIIWLKSDLDKWLVSKRSIQFFDASSFRRGNNNA